MSEQKIPFAVVRARRAGARLAAVQALFQMEQAGQGVDAVIREFCNDRLGMGPDGDPIEEADPDIFCAIVRGVVAHQTEIDRSITEHLNDCLLYTSPSPRDLSTSRMPSSA